MIRIIGLAGSLRRNSFNRRLLEAAAKLAPEGCRIEVRTLHGIPLYDGDVEAEQGIPGPVRELKDAIAGSQALLLVTPEYNHSMPGVMKNAIDWLSRPPADIDRVFRGRPVTLCGATPGGGGTRSSQAAWLPVLRALKLVPWSEQLLFVAGAGKLFDEDGGLSDDGFAGRLAEYVAGYCQFVRACVRP